MKTTREYTPGRDSDDEALAHEYNVDLWPFRGALVTYSELPGYSDARYLVCNNDDTMTQEQIDELKKSMTESEKRTDVEKANLSNLFDQVHRGGRRVRNVRLGDGFRSDIRRS